LIAFSSSLSVYSFIGLGILLCSIPES
jgi:hypothetical protein